MEALHLDPKSLSAQNQQLDLRRKRCLGQGYC